MRVKVSKKLESPDRQKGGAGYPYGSFSQAAKVAAAVRDLGGNNSDIKKSVLAGKLGVEESSPSLSQNLMSAKTFGLIEGHGSYRLTEAGKRFFFPTDDHEKQRALLAMVKSPSIFGSLIDRFDGSKVPAADVLVNILHRDFDVSPSWRPRVAALFLNSLREAQIIDAAGCLRYKASHHGAILDKMAGMTERPAEIVAPVPERLPNSSTSMRSNGRIASDDVVTFRVSRDDGVQLETNGELSAIAWEKLNRIVQALKPDGHGPKRSDHIHANGES